MQLNIDLCIKRSVFYFLHIGYQLLSSNLLFFKWDYLYKVLLNLWKENTRKHFLSFQSLICIVRISIRKSTKLILGDIRRTIPSSEYKNLSAKVILKLLRHSIYKNENAQRVMYNNALHCENLDNQTLWKLVWWVIIQKMTQ